MWKIIIPAKKLKMFVLYLNIEYKQFIDQGLNMTQIPSITGPI